MIRAALALVVLTFGAWADAAARSLTVEDFHASIDVRADGTVRIEERLRLDFRGRWNGIFRDIPYGYTDAAGIRGTIRLRMDAVTDEDGNALWYEEQRQSGRVRVKIRVPGAQDASRTVVLRYHVENVIRRQSAEDAGYGLHDELYWNVTGNEWPVPIVRAVAEVRLPEGVPVDEVVATAYTGPPGARGRRYEAQPFDGERLVFATTGPLPPRSGLTIAVGFPPGHVAHPSGLRRALWAFGANWFFGVPPLLALGWFAVWWTRGRDSLRGRTIIPEWEAPDALRPAEIGVLIDDRLDRRDLTAAIVDLAVRRALTIREDEEGQFLLENPDPEGKGLVPYERELLHALFAGGGTSVPLSALDRKFYKQIPPIRKRIMNRLVARGFLRRSPDAERAIWLALTAAAAVGAGILGAAVRAPLPYWVLLGIAVVAMLWLAMQMPQRTRRGLDALARIKGMEEYLLTAEQERMRELPLTHFEKLLPFAVALGVQRRWTDLFKGLFEQPPEWLRVRSGAWSAGALTTLMDGFTRDAQASLYSVPRTEAGASGGSGWSGGSGFSGGGGYSGGGFGGGGGGGW